MNKFFINRKDQGGNVKPGTSSAQQLGSSKASLQNSIKNQAAMQLMRNQADDSATPSNLTSINPGAGDPSSTS